MKERQAALEAVADAAARLADYKPEFNDQENENAYYDLLNALEELQNVGRNN